MTREVNSKAVAYRKKSGLWFDLPNSPYAVGHGIINGRHGIAIVSVATMKPVRIPREIASRMRL